MTQAPGYMLRLPDEAFDVARFERLVADAGSRLGRDDAAGASSVLREALALWRGEAYAEFADEDWARPRPSGWRSCGWSPTSVWWTPSWRAAEPPR